MSPRPGRCPTCQRATIVPIAYGYPGPEMWAAVDRGEIVLGGCVVTPENPSWECTACQQRGG
ncbi:MAG: hypothetical protein ACI9C1_002860 [Candidatus Aldehydirespiratoraceae bacterium]|jgi:hypothetical protein